MGGRGSKSSETPPKISRFKNSENQTKKKKAEEETSKKLPAQGNKVQAAYIDYVKKQINIDLTPARDTQFDNRKGFNIDTRAIKPTELSSIIRLAQTYPGGYNVQFLENGYHRLYIQVERKKKIRRDRNGGKR